MKVLRYERVANSAVFIAIVAAILFDRAESARWFFGGLGVLSGVSAAVIYFVNQWRESDNTNSDGLAHVEGDRTFVAKAGTTVAEQSAEQVVEETNRENVFELPAKRLEFAPLTNRIIQPYMDRWWGTATGIVYHHHHIRAASGWVVGSQEFSHPSRADEIVTIVDRLCAARDDSFEFVIDPDGTFTIRRLDPKLEQGREVSIEAGPRTIDDETPLQKPN